MKQTSRKIKLMMTVILLGTGTWGVVMGLTFASYLIALLGSVNLAFASFIGMRYLISKSQKEKK